MMSRETLSSSEVNNILRAYRQATDIAGRGGSPDEEIAAYNKVIELGRCNGNVGPEEALKYNMIMYWSYNNLADALFNKSFKNALNATGDNRRAFAESLKYYRRGLKFAQDNLEKVSVLNRMAENYKYLGDEKHLCKIKQRVIANFNAEDKRCAYCDVAGEVKDPKCAAAMYEEALNYVNDEKVSLPKKFENTLFICEKLLTLYDKRKNRKNYQRILTLRENTQNLLTTCQKKGGCSF